MYSKSADKTARPFVLSLLFFFLTSSLELSANDGPFALLPGYTLNKVVIDAGHGGKDPGCLGSSVREKDIALKIALKLGGRIEDAFPEIEVIYTRTTDVFVPLHERARIANRAAADLFISIHCNTVAARNRAQGTETYVMGLHRAEDNLRVAKRENSAITLEDDYIANYDGYDPDSPEAHIILSMYQNAYLEQSILLADAIEHEFSTTVGRVSRGVKQAGFLVLRNTTMPSVLVEAGFLSHDDDESFLSSDSGQNAIADGLFRAFKDFRVAATSWQSGIASGEDGAGTDSSVAETGIPTRFFVQLLASDRKFDLSTPPWSNYDKLVTREEDNFYKYLAGPFRTAEEAHLSRDEFERSGFEGAFVVSYRGDERVPVSTRAPGRASN